MLSKAVRGGVIKIMMMVVATVKRMLIVVEVWQNLTTAP
jgi:hypothetical protein